MSGPRRSSRLSLVLASALLLAGCPKKNKPPPVERVWLGEHAACAALVTGELRCQGNGDHGRLGPAVVPGAPHGPVALAIPGKILSVVHRPTSLCVIVEGAPDVCYGALALAKDQEASPGCRLSGAGQVTCSGPRWPDPPKLEGLGGVVELAEGRAHACARLGSGTVVCWGANDRGQLASPPPRGSLAPVPVQGIYGAVSIVAAGDGTCTVQKDKSVRCWGDNTSERLSVGHGPILDVPTPVHF